MNEYDMKIARLEAEADQLREALFDVIDGMNWWDIMERACVSEERAKEIHQLVNTKESHGN